MRVYRLCSAALAVLLILAMLPVYPVVAQGGLPDAEQAILDRLTAAIAATADYTSFTATNTVQFEQVWVAVLNDQVVAGEDFRLDRQEAFTSILTADGPNIQQDITLDVAFGETTGSPGGYTLTGEVRIVDGTVYANAAYAEPNADLPALPEDWVIYAGEPTRAFYPGLADLNLDWLTEQASGDTLPLIDLTPQQLQGLPVMVSRVESAITLYEDGPAVERITLGVSAAGAEALGIFFDPNDPVAQLALVRTTEDPLTLIAELVDDQLVALGYEFALTVDDLDLSDLSDTPAGLTLDLQTSGASMLRLADINADLALATAPELPTLAGQPGFAAPAVDMAPSWWNDRVFYEVFVRSFYDSDADGIGDLPGLIERLDYLNDGDPATTDDLGVTGIWLMPIAQSPSYHGYDVFDYYTIEEDYGTNEDFLALVEAAHERGIAVVVDLVMNHTSTEHPWFIASQAGDAEYADWYIWENADQGFLSPWGSPVWHAGANGQFYYGLFWSGMPDLNYANPDVTAAMYDVIDFWLTELGVDGFRLDAIRHLIEDGPVQENTPATLAWLEDFHDHVQAINPDALTIGEVWDTSVEVVPYVGDRVDIAFEFDLATAILQAARFGFNTGLYRAQSTLLDLYAPGQYATFLTNHDQDRVMSQLAEDEGAARVAAAILLTSPGVPFIYYGEEIGMTGTKPDPDIRTPLPWTDQRARGGFTGGTPWHVLNPGYRARNIETLSADPDSLWRYYRDLIALRNAHPALRAGAMQLIETDSTAAYSFLRYGDDETLLVVVNLSDEPLADYSLRAPESLLSGEVDAEIVFFGGGAVVPPVLDDAGGFADYTPVEVIAPQSAVVIRLQ